MWVCLPLQAAAGPQLGRLLLQGEEGRGAAAHAGAAGRGQAVDVGLHHACHAPSHPGEPACSYSNYRTYPSSDVLIHCFV